MELLRIRKDRGKLQSEVEEATDLGKTNLSRWEKGTTSPSIAAAEKLLRYYEVDEAETRRLLQLVRDARRRGQPLAAWEPLEKLLVFERQAARIEELALIAVPGLLQTEEYARAVLQAGILGADVEQHVRVRMKRAEELFGREHPPEYWGILRESVLQSEVGGAAVMRDQCAHLAEMARRPYITLLVIPNRHGAHAGMSNAFTMMSFDPPMGGAAVYFDHLTDSWLRDEKAEVERYDATYRHLVKKALPEEESLEMIEKAKERYS